MIPKTGTVQGMEKHPQIILITSLDPLLRESVIAYVESTRPDVAILRHDLDQVETHHVVTRRLVFRGITSETSIGLDEGCCLTCLVRDDVRAVAQDLTAPFLLAVIPTVLDPTAFTMLDWDDEQSKQTSLDDRRTPTQSPCLVAVVRSQSLEKGLRDSNPPAPILTESLISDLSTAELLTLQIEHADIILHDNQSARSSMILSSLAETMARFGFDSHPNDWLATEPHMPVERGDRASKPTQMTPLSYGGIAHLRWRRRRPLHPERFARAFEDGVLGGALRVRGSMWFASRPNMTLTVSILAESCEICQTGEWQDIFRIDSDERNPHGVAVATYLDSSSDWHPYYGDRFHQLSIVCEAHELPDLMEELAACLLTDHELACGPSVWQSYDDPLSDGRPENDCSGQ